MRLLDLIIELEGIRLKVYDDATGTELKKGDTIVGYPTIGIGRETSKNGISELEARFLCMNDVGRIQREALDAFPWMKSMNVVRQDVLHLMVFQMGVEGTKGFKQALAHMQMGLYHKAADELLNSLWAKQTPKRAKRMAEMMRTGRYN